MEAAKHSSVMQQQHAQLAHEHVQREHDALEHLRSELSAAHAALDSRTEDATRARAAAASTQEHLESQLQQALQAASAAQRMAESASGMAHCYSPLPRRTTGLLNNQSPLAKEVCLQVH